MLRGIKHELEFTKKFLETTMLKWNRKDVISNVEQAGEVQHALRPIELFECVFPKEQLHNFMKMLNIVNDDKYQGWTFKTQMNLMRKMLGAEKFPDIDPKQVDKKVPFIPRRMVAVHPIGIKKDEEGITGGKFDQERL